MPRFDRISVCFITRRDPPGPTPLECFREENTARVDTPVRRCLAGSARTRANPAGLSYPKIPWRRPDYIRGSRTPPDERSQLHWIDVRLGDRGQT